MLYGSVSIKGSYHDENQDSSYSGICKDIYALVVSDGLGSKSNSKLGSQKICESIRDTIEEFKLMDNDLDVDKFIKAIHKKWIYKLKDEDIKQCCATVLACIIMPCNIIAMRLGDGFISVILEDESITLFDKKENYFENETDCMSEELYLDKWEVVNVENDNFLGVIACSDGVEIEDMSDNGYSSFAKDFIEGYKFDKTDDIKKDINNWLSSWPGRDDKTIAFMIEESEQINE